MKNIRKIMVLILFVLLGVNVSVVVNAEEPTTLLVTYEENGGSSVADENVVNNYGFLTSSVIEDGGISSRNIVIYDVDLDGDLDVLAGYFTTSELNLYVNDGFGSFTETSVDSSTNNVHAANAGNFDGDEYIEIIVAEYSNGVSIYNKDGGSSWIKTQLPGSLSGLRSVEPFDLDGDGDLDILVTSSTDDKVSWYENDGSSNFTLHTLSDSSNYAFYATAADLDKDDDLDVISVSDNDQTLEWYENTGSGNFSAGVEISTSITGARKVLAADIDYDGYQDLIVSDYGTDSIYWYKNNGNKTFTLGGTVSSSVDTWNLDIGDFDSDGYIDIVSVDRENGSILWFKNNGTGIFSAQTAIDLNGFSPLAIAVGDLNGDGILDVVTGDQTKDTIEWYENNFTSRVTEPSDPTKTGYIFSGWYSDPELNNIFDFDSVITTNITLYASWIVDSQTISFDVDGGSLVADVILDYNTVLAQPNSPTKPEYTFDGWYTEDTFDNLYNFETLVTCDFILYASWTMQTITFDEIADQTIEAGTLDIDWTTLISNEADINQGTLTKFEVTDNVDYDTIGTYTVTVKVQDESLNETSQSFNVTVVDTTPPTFDEIADQTIEVGTLDIDWITLIFNEADNSDGTLTKVEVTDNVDYDTIGTYTVTVKVQDESSNETSQIFNVTVVDTTIPVITLTGDSTVYVEYEGTYEELGATCSDNYDTECTVEVSGIVETNILETYTVTYNVTDTAGNAAEEVTRTVIVQDTTPPTFDEIADQTIEAGTLDIDWTTLIFNEADNSDGTLTKVEVIDEVEYDTLGTYFVLVVVQDESFNDLARSFNVTVVDTTPPTFDEIADQTIEAGTLDIDWTTLIFNEADNSDGTLTKVEVTDNVDYDTIGTYTVTVKVQDESSNETSQIFNVTVVDTTIPVITLTGDSTVYVEYEGTYEELGATCSDNYDTECTVEVSGIVETNILETYTVTYNVTDTAGNAAEEVTRTVIVQDTTPPTFDEIADQTIEVGTLDIDWTTLIFNEADNSDGTLTKVEVIDEVEYDTLGTYFVLVVVQDESFNDLARSFNVTVVDTTIPVITLNGNSEIDVEFEGTYTELGATCEDNYDAECTVVVTGSVDENTLGEYVISYNVTDSNGNIAVTVTRTVTVVDTTIPVITLNGNSEIDVEFEVTYTELGATCEDNYDAECTVVVTGSVDENTLGEYVISYNVTDSNGNIAVTVTRTVTVVDTTIPVITLNGNSEIDVEFEGTYTELGATCEDNYDAECTVVVTGSVDENTLGEYVISYNVTDSNGNIAVTVTRTVTVVDTTIPVITLNGNSEIDVEFEGTYTELGATCEDNYDAECTVVVTGSVDENTLGEYVISYNVTDSNGNIAVTVTRTVTVVDTTIPVITLNGNSEIDVEFEVTYTELGATCEDNYDAECTVVVTGSVDENTLGEYVISYNVTDSNGNIAVTVTRTVTVVDTTIPVITLNGNSEIDVEFEVTYTELGATCEDNYDAECTVVVTGSVDENTLGEYVISYNVTDSNGNIAVTVTRTVTVVDTTIPVITLNGNSEIDVEFEGTYTELGATCEDNYDAECTVVVTGSVDENTLGEYVISYNVTDSNGNIAVTVTRTVTVVDTTIPVITLNGNSEIDVEFEVTYTELGATCEDNYDAECTVVVTGSVDENTLGEYVISYNVTDSNGNIAVTVTRTVTVVDTTIPVITLNGNSEIDVEFEGTYTELGATCEDNYDAECTVVVTGSVDENTLGEYVISYNVTDTAGNAAEEVTRTVIVQDTTPPTFDEIADQTIEVGTLDIDWITLIFNEADNSDGTLTKVEVTDNVDYDTIGTYTVTVKVQDESSNETSQIFNVTVVDTTIPVITLTGDSTVYVEYEGTYEELGATCSDNYDTECTVEVSGIVETNILETYTVTYNVTDTAGNAAEEVTRTVIVRDTTIPVITRLEDESIIMSEATNFIPQTAIVIDNVDIDLVAIITYYKVDGITVLTNLAEAINEIELGNDIVIKYNAIDTDFNEAFEVVITITVIDDIAPVVEGVEDEQIFKKDTEVLITFNEGTATLNGNAFESGTVVNKDGSYDLIVIDGAGNDTQVTFQIEKSNIVVIAIIGSTTSVVGIVGFVFRKRLFGL